MTTARNLLLASLLFSSPAIAGSLTPNQRLYSTLDAMRDTHPAAFAARFPWVNHLLTSPAYMAEVRAKYEAHPIRFALNHPGAWRVVDGYTPEVPPVTPPTPLPPPDLPPIGVGPLPPPGMPPVVSAVAEPSSCWQLWIGVGLMSLGALMSATAGRKP